MEEKKKDLLSCLIAIAGPYKIRYIGAVIFAVFGVAAGMIPFYAVAKMLILLIDGNKIIADYGMWCMIAALAHLAKILFSNLSTSISHRTTFYALRDLRKKLVQKLSNMPMGDLQNTPSGYFKDIIVDRVESMEVTLAHLLPEMTANILVPVLLLVYLATLDWRMALVSLITLPVGMFFMSMPMRTYAKKYVGSVAVSKRMNQTIVEYVNGIEVIKAFNQSGKSYGKYIEAVRDNATYFYNWMKSCQLPMSAYQAICPSTLAAVLPIGFLFYMNGSLPAAEFITIIILSLGIIGPLLTSMNYMDSLAIVGTTVFEIESILASPELNRPNSWKDLKEHTVEINHLSFSYNREKDKQVLKDISFAMRPGTITALVGPSGSGKSTIAKLLAGFWDIETGQISIGGVESKKIPLAQLSTEISYVSQDNYLFDDMIMENIRIGKKGASDEEVIEVAKITGCDDFIRKLEKGYQTMAGGKGEHLSGGERQRIAIARAMLKDAPIIILDEASAYIDPENEATIQKALSKLIQGKTVMVIAHRLSTITTSEQIIVLQDGVIKAVGKHRELLETCPLYMKMWNAHMGAKDGEIV